MIGRSEVNVRLLGSNVLKISVQFSKIHLLGARQSSVPYIRQAVRRKNTSKVRVAFHFILFLCQQRIAKVYGGAED